MSRKIKKSELVLEIKKRLKEIDSLVKDKLKREREFAKLAHQRWKNGLSKKIIVEKSKHVGGVY